MRVFYVFALILQFVPIRAYSQLTANTTMTPSQMVQNVLLGNGVTATNITYTGIAGSRGTFTCSGSCNLGISNGIVLCTGYIDGTGTTNLGGDASNFISDDLFLSGDPDLDQVANGFTFDAVSLEFDFSVASDSVSFRYVFASEEYNEFVASSYNDVFGFFISGPCFPPGGTNIALIPGTSTPVTINNVNNGYSTGSSSGPCSNCSYYVDNYTGNSVAFDGFTTALTASAKVVPCATYHIKIVIADVGDGIYDSAVFLEANSFSSIGTVPIIVDNVTHYSDSSLSICPGQNVQICAATPCTSGASVLQWSNGSSSICQTAIPGNYSYTFTNTVNVCTATSPVISVTQPAGSSVAIAQDTISSCPGTPVTITATGSGNLTWNTGATSQSITVNSPGWYHVSTTGACGPVSDSVFVQLNGLSASISGATNVCAGIPVILTSYPAGMQYLWSDGQTTQNITVSQPGNYMVTVTTANGCTSTANVYVTQNNPPSPVIQGNSNICPGQTTSFDAGNPLYTNYIWSNNEITPQINVSAPGNYTVTVTDTNGCTATASVTLTLNQLPSPSITGNTSFCDGEATTLDAGNGFANYVWSDNSNSQTISINTAGNYSVTVTDANGCTGTDSVIVNINNSPVPAISGLNSICDGNSTTLDAGGGFANYLWNNNSTSQSIVVNTAGNYTVTVTDSNGCTGTATHSIIINPLPVPLINGPASFCVGGSTTLGAGSGFSNYLWSTGEVTQNITVSSAGIVSVIVSDTNGCSGTDSLAITEQLSLSPVIIGNNSICPGGNSMLDAGAGYISYLWSDSSTSQTITVSNAGNYLVTVTDAAGCTGTAIFNLTILAPPSAIITGNNSICSGDSTVFDAGGNFTGYLWSDNSTSQTINVNTAGTYSVTIADNNGCTGTASITLTINNLPATTITGINTICDGDVTTFDAGQGYNSYLWSDNSTTQTITANSAGIYSVTVTDTNGCSGTASHTLIVNPLPQPVISGSTSFCPSGFTVLDAGPGFASYNWSTGEFTQSINMNTTGICSVIVTDNDGCFASTSVNITLEPNLSPVITGNTNICVGQNTILDAGNSFATYQWSTGSTSPSISVDSSGTYTVTVTDISGCDGTASVNVNVNNPAQSFITGSTSFCAGGFTILNAGTGFTNYLWSTGDTSQTITVNSAGPVEVIVTDNNGCMSTANINVQVLANLTPQISGNVNICQGETTLLDAGLGYTTYLWSNGSTGQTINVNSTGNYQVTVTDASGCSGTDAININLNNNPVPVITGDTEFCEGNSSILNAGNNYASYLWSNNENQSNINVNSSGNYIVTVTDVNGCTGSASVNIIVNPLPIPVINGDTLICLGENTILDAGSGFLNYHWSNNQVTQTINVNTNGNYSVTVTDQNGCSASTQININVSIPEAEITTNGPTTFCDGNDVTLTANPGISYLWSTGDIAQQITVNAQGTYFVTVIDNAGCDTVSNPIEIIVNDNPLVNFSADPLVGCAPHEVKFNNYTTNAVNYYWTFGDDTNSNLINPEHVFIEPGYYSVTLWAVSSEGCEAELSYNDLIFAADKPKADFAYSPDELLMFASTCKFFDNSEDAVTWQWQFGDGKESALKNPQHYYNEPGTYNVKLIVSNLYGCRNEKETKLVVTPFYLPNAFTPNKDGTNEAFYPFGFEMDIKEFQLLIFDRWGNLIFESDHPHNTWNGHYHNGEMVPEDVYVYSYTITTPDNRVHKFKGKVNLIR